MHIFLLPFYLVVGLRTAVFGKLPTTLFKYVLAGGEYDLPPIPARLLGLFILSPVFATWAGASLPDSQYFVVQISYMIAVAIVSLFIASKIRRSDSNQTEETLSNNASIVLRSIKLVGRFLVVFLIAAQLMAVITALSSGLWLLMPAVIFSIFSLDRPIFTGDFWTDVLLALLLFTFFEFAALCIYWAFPSWFKRPA